MQQFLALPCRKGFIVGARSLPDDDYQTLRGKGIACAVVADTGHSMAWENPATLAQALTQLMESAA